MTYNLVIADEARLDIIESYMYYDEQLVGLGDSFENEISKALVVIQKNPFQFQIKYLDVRVIYMKKFPFGIHYIIEQNTVRIFGVYHTRKSPSNWFNRF